MTMPANVNKQVSKAVRLALMASTVPMIASTNLAIAQDGDEEATVEEIVVTGSRIKRADLDSASPVTVLDREDILAAGITDVGNLIQRMPSMSGSPIGTTTNNGGNGSVQVDLRGMGVDRTLTLINGKRSVDRGDYQTIPAAMIERVEILKDGASAVYGADAVAGVVNIITRRDFEGLTIEAQTSDFFDMDDGSQQSVSLVAGKVFDGGNFVFGAEYVKQNQAFQADAPWDIFTDSYYIYPEGCENQVTAPYDGTPTGGCYVLGSSRIPEARLRFADGQGTFINEGNGLIPDDGRFYNYAPVNYIQTPYERTNLFAEANIDISETTQFFASVRGNLRTSAQELAPLPYDSRPGFDPAFSGVFNGVAFNGISQDNFYLREAATAAGLAIAPVDQARRRMVETNRRFEQDVSQFQANIGLRGTIRDAGIFGDLDWDVTYGRGHRSRVDNDFGQFSGLALQNALGPSADLDNDGTPECYTDINDPATLVTGCVPLNFFGGPGSITQDQVDYVSTTLVDTYVTRFEEAGFSFSGSAFDLPGGEFGWAAGFNYLADEFTYSADSAKQQNAVTGSVGDSTNGSLYANSVFVEFFAPVYANGEQTLDLKGGLRFDDYNRFDSETTWQFGVEFQVIESLKLRATAGTVFRAPTINDLFQGLADNAPSYVDPCIPTNGAALPPGCAQLGVQTDTQLPARVGGNPNLIPETGETFTAGAVWTPAFGNGDLTVTMDYWKVDIEDGISSLGVQYILEDCYVRENQSSCALITRTNDYNISEVLDLNLNVAEQGAAGVDTEVRYNFDTDFGQFEASFLWAYLIERTKTAEPTATEDGLTGRYTDTTAEDGGAYARNKANYSLQWFRDGLSIGYLGEYISGLQADTQCNCGGNGKYIQIIDEQLYHDIVGSYEFGQGTTVSMGITNVTNEPPPFIDFGFNATTDPATYRLFGRGYYLRLSHSFE